jgi:hypothetical protein
MAVRMRHPGVDADYLAQPGQVPHLQATGWEVVEGQAEQGEVWPAEARRFGGQPVVRMSHPDVADEITVAESAVPMHQSQGWQRVEPEAPAEAEDAGEPVAGDDPRTVDDLKNEIRALNADRGPDEKLPVSGTKAALLARLSDAHEQDASGEAAGPNEDDA